MIVIDEIWILHAERFLKTYDSVSTLCASFGFKRALK